MVENIYYTLLDYCYLARHMNLESNNINTVISNVETLLTEMKALRDANVEFIAKASYFIPTTKRWQIEFSRTVTRRQQPKICWIALRMIRRKTIY